jgi:Protein of unknown function (DUF2892)
VRARTLVRGVSLYGNGNERFSPTPEGRFHVLSQEPAGWERAIRVIAGLALIAWGLLAFPAAPLGYAVATGGLTAILTGFFSFCPMCAMVGRKLPSA